MPTFVLIVYNNIISYFALIKLYYKILSLAIHTYNLYVWIAKPKILLLSNISPKPNVYC